ncbi:unnamed protein product, partial [marine sediment metagenome]
DLLNPRKAEVFLSEINLIELSEKLADELRMLRCFEEGLSILEIRKTELEKHRLTEKDLDTINQEIKSTIIELPFLVSNKTPSLGSKSLRVLTGICTKYSIFFIDALHFHIAELIGCQYFVTGDLDLSKRLENLLSELGGSVVDVCYAKSFKNKEFKRFIR